MDTAARTQSEVAEPKAVRLNDKIEKLNQQMQRLKTWSNGCAKSRMGRSRWPRDQWRQVVVAPASLATKSRLRSTTGIT